MLPSVAANETLEAHARFREFLLDLRAEDLPALRHLLLCPLCQALARALLTETAAGPKPGEIPPRSGPPPGPAGSGER